MRIMPVSRGVGEMSQQSRKREEEVKILQVEKIQERNRIKRPEFEKTKKVSQPRESFFLD
jgi:regulator of replication initiation timing